MIPSFNLRRKPAHKDINVIFKEKFDTLDSEYRKAVTDVMKSCVHQWGAWEYRWHQSIGGGYAQYERECDLCGLKHYRDDRPDTQEPITETRDSIIDVY